MSAAEAVRRRHPAAAAAAVPTLKLVQPPPFEEEPPPRGLECMSRAIRFRRHKLSAMMLLSATFGFTYALVAAIVFEAHPLVCRMCAANLMSSICWHVVNLYMDGTPRGVAGVGLCWCDRITVAVAVSWGGRLMYTLELYGCCWCGWCVLRDECCMHLSVVKCRHALQPLSASLANLSRLAAQFRCYSLPNTCWYPKKSASHALLSIVACTKSGSQGLCGAASLRVRR